LDNLLSLHNKADEMEIEVSSLKEENSNIQTRESFPHRGTMQVRIDLKKLQSDNIRLAKAAATNTDNITPS